MSEDENKYFLVNVKSYGTILTIDKTFKTQEEAITWFNKNSLDYNSWLTSGQIYIAKLDRVVFIQEAAVPAKVTSLPLISYNPENAQTEDEIPL